MSETEMDRDSERDDAVLAAEFALGLLEGEELMAARGKLARDPAFAARTQWWEDWFVPLTDEVKGAEPGPEVWAAIAAGVDAQRGTADGAAATPAATNVIDLQARVRRWQWTAALTSAAAAVLLAVLIFAPGSEPAPLPGTAPTGALAASDPLVAQVPIGETGLRLDVTYIPESEKLLVGAIGLTADGVHDHELWLVPADGGALTSLGVVQPGEVRSVALPKDIARQFGVGVELVLTREPIGGKPEGVDAGPVVAQGAFSPV